MSLVKQTVVAPPVAISSSVPTGLSVATAGRMSQMQTEVLTRSQLAIMLPRNWLDVGSKLLLACQDPEFAKEAYYRKPVGGEDKLGLNIRFVERALQIMRNISVDTSPESEDDHAVHYRMTVTDLESNTPTSETFRVSKTHEARYVDEDQTVISERTNGKQEKVYLIASTDDQLNAKIRAVTSKVKRSLVLPIIPVEIRQQCLNKCLEITLDADKKDPAAALKSIIMSFLSVGVDVPELKEYLGKPAQQATEKELQELRGIFALIREGEMTWKAVVSAKREREATKSAVAKFVENKKKDKAKQKAARNGAVAAPPPATDGTAAPPKRRGRPPAAAAATGSDTVAVATPKPETPKAPRASLRDDDEDDDTDPPSSDGSPVSSTT